MPKTVSIETYESINIGDLLKLDFHRKKFIVTYKELTITNSHKQNYTTIWLEEVK